MLVWLLCLLGVLFWVVGLAAVVWVVVFGCLCDLNVCGLGFVFWYLVFLVWWLDLLLWVCYVLRLCVVFVDFLCCVAGLMVYWQFGCGAGVWCLEQLFSVCRC